MKIDLNDPRITAFALGELKGNDAIEIARAVRTDPRVRAAVDEARETSSFLMETLGGGEVHRLTSDQREAVRSAGSSPVITDIASARVPFWKNPAVAGIGVAAAVALTLYMVGGRPPGGGGSGGGDTPAGWNWSQVTMDDLTAPVILDPSGNSSIPASEASHAVSAAISDDTHSFRQEVEKRISESDPEKARSLPELKDNAWNDISLAHRLVVPLSSGATSWPWVKRYIEQQKALPPRQSVRIEEMVNHFSYKSPTMIQSRGLAADMEICQTPWNPNTLLLAVHIGTVTGATEEQIDVASASLVMSSDRIKRARLLGYAAIKSSSEPESSPKGTPMRASRSRGNYVIYELELNQNVVMNSDTALPLVMLDIGSDDNLVNGPIKSWIHASPDLRFASTVAATGMLLAGTPSAGELDPARLRSLVDLLGNQDAATLVSDRREALKVIRQASALLDASTGER